MSRVVSSELAAARQVVEAQLRESDRSAFLESLYVPVESRSGVQALHLFASELSGLRQRIQQPMIGEIRLQYWIDFLQGEPHGDIAAHPLALSLADTIKRFHLPSYALIDMAEAYRFDLYDDPMPDEAALETYLGATEGALIRLNCLTIAGGNDPGGAEASGFAGMAIGLTRLLRQLPLHAARGQIYLPLPKDEFFDATAYRQGKSSPGLDRAVIKARQQARQFCLNAEQTVREVQASARMALLRLGLVEPCLKRHIAPMSQVILSPLRQYWLLWRYRRFLFRD